MMHPASPEIRQAAEALADGTVDDVLNWAVQRYGAQLAMTTAFGPGGIVLLDKVRVIAPELRVFFIDTGQHFPETLALMERLQGDWNLNLTVLQPEPANPDEQGILGDRPWMIDPELCCHYQKVKPLLAALSEASAWLNALRRDQSDAREQLAPVEIDGRGTVKVHPLFNWTLEDVWAYVRQKDLPYNPLHDQGYRSIGCIPCTTPVGDSEAERAGRWRGLAKTECGLHVTREARDRAYDPSNPHAIDRRYPNELLLTFRHRHLANETGDVLDLGFGTGTDLLYMARERFTPHGIEMSRPAVEIARRRFAQAGIEADLRLRTLEHGLEYDDNSFAFVYSFTALSYLTSRDALGNVVAEVHRVLAPGKALLCLLPTMDHQLLLADLEPLGEGLFCFTDSRPGMKGAEIYIPPSEDDLLEAFGAGFAVSLGRYEVSFGDSDRASFHVVTARKR